MIKRLHGVVLVCALLVVNHSAAETFNVTNDDILVVDFVLPRVPAYTPDTMVIFWGLYGSAELEDRGTILGSLGPPQAGYGWMVWKSPSSAYVDDRNLFSITTIDFSSIIDGSIEGRIRYHPSPGVTVFVDTEAEDGQVGSIPILLGVGGADGSISTPLADKPIITSVSVERAAGSCKLSEADFRDSVAVYTDADSKTMLAEFRPSRSNPECGLDDVARDMGFSHFQWVQVINRFPRPLCIRDFGLLTPNLLPSLDPPYGGLCGQPADYLPYYWDEGQDPSMFGSWIEQKTAGDFEVQFKDAPKVRSPLFPSEYMEFTTSLVGVVSGSSYVPLYTWNWKSNYNTLGGGIFDSTARDLDDPDGGEGGIFEVTILPTPTAAPAEVQDIWQSSGGFTEPPQYVDIHVEPGPDGSCTMADGRGVIPVAVLGSSELDVLEIDQYSLKFAGAEVRKSGNDTPLCSFEFSNEDEYLDLKCKFDETTVAWIGDRYDAYLSGELSGGTTFAAVETICTKPKVARKSKKEREVK